LPEDHAEPQLTEPLPPVKSIGGQELKQLFAASTAWLERHAAYINSLNVFPVPDGDSGTNMLLTMQAALREVNSSPDHSASAICNALSHGALLGARGNSGVILSQIIRGFSRAVDKREAITANDFAVAMVEGSRTAYKGVVKPVEGTILTVCREAADASMIAAAQSDDLRRVLAKTVEAARASVIRTPLLLPVLKEAGVVDAGGQGLLVVLEGALKHLNGEPMELIAAGEGAQALQHISREEGWGFDIQFHIRGSNLDVDSIRDRIASMGESALIVGDPSLIKVHVHAPAPGAILDYGCSVGVITNVVIENMQEQYIGFMAEQTSARPPVTAEEISGITIIVVAPGAGLARVFESLGAGAIVAGGQTMNPSTEDILKAIETVKSDRVIVLPNNKNIIPAAEQAKEIAKKKVTIIPTKTIPQGIAALLAFNFQSDLEANAKAMARAAQNIQTAEITTATRSVTLDEVKVKQGQVIGLIDGILAGAGEDRAEIALRMLKQMRTADGEIVTIYYGDTVTASEAQSLAAQIRQAFPAQEIEVVNGGQPHYHYIISVE
jgi:DAK2 domain fusion protein YloV